MINSNVAFTSPTTGQKSKNIAYGDNLDINYKLYSGVGKSILNEFEYKKRDCSTYGGYIVNPKECLCVIKIA